MAVGEGVDDGDGDADEITEDDLELEVGDEAEIRCGISLYGTDEG